MYLEFMIIGLIGGLLGIFYRNCLKVEDMIFNPLYKKVLKPWALGSNRFLSFYCLSSWILYLLQYYLDHILPLLTLPDIMGSVT